jgi:hypothetical protein
MKLQSSTVAVCLLVMVCFPAGLSGPLRRPDVQQPGKKTVDSPVVPKNLVVQDCPNPVPVPKPEVDLCSLAKSMQPKVKPDKVMGTQSLERRKQFSWKYHEDLSLGLNLDEVVWSCASDPTSSFQILSIERVRNPHDQRDRGVQPAPAAPSPFCKAFHEKRIGQIQPPGTKLHSGVPITGVCQWYKYSFIVGQWSAEGGWAHGSTEIDPHLIITDPTGKYRKDPCAPHGPESPDKHPESKH